MSSKDDEILIKNTVNKIASGKSSKFLNEREQKIIVPYLNKEKLKYNIYYPYKNADKGIIYCDRIPLVSCLKINCSKPLEHRDILGSVFALSLDIHNFGDIIINGSDYFLIVLDEVMNYVQYNLITVGRYSVDVEVVNLKVINDYERKYDKLLINSKSVRLDAVIAKLANISRGSVEKLLKDKLVLLNTVVSNNGSYFLKEDDTFSVRGLGKYKFGGIEKTTKSGSLILIIYKYS